MSDQGHWVVKLNGEEIVVPEESTVYDPATNTLKISLPGIVLENTDRVEWGWYAPPGPGVIHVDLTTRKAPWTDYARRLPEEVT